MGINTLKQLALAQIITQCEQEAHRSRAEESGYCFELFRRALEAGDENAWVAIQRQYTGLMISWLRRAAGPQPNFDHEEDLIQEAFTRFWSALSQKQQDLSERFAHVGAVLSYLNRCTVTAQLDFQRQQQRHSALQQRLQQEFHVRKLADGLGKQLDRIHTEAQVETVRQWMQTEVSDELEKLLYTLLYEQGLKPREVVARYPQQFPDTKHVRRVQARLISRARRALTSG